MNSTERIVNRLLKENTGTALCDSGGAYGRNWERNQKRNFKQEPAHILRFDGRGDRLEIECTHNLFHFLVHGLEFDPGVDRQFKNFARRKEHRDEPWLATMQAFVEEQGWERSQVVNTYNGEDMLSQTIQYLESGEHILLQVHGGCDARGGYSSARAFTDGGENWLYNNARAELYPSADPVETAIADLFPEIPGERPHWTTYNAGYSWETSTGCKSIGDYPFTMDPAERKPGVIFIDEDKNGYCPITGAKLVLSYY